MQGIPRGVNRNELEVFSTLSTNTCRRRPIAPGRDRAIFTGGYKAERRRVSADLQSSRSGLPSSTSLWTRWSFFLSLEPVQLTALVRAAASAKDLLHRVRLLLMIRPSAPKLSFEVQVSSDHLATRLPASLLFPNGTVWDSAQFSPYAQLITALTPPQAWSSANA